MSEIFVLFLFLTSACVNIASTIQLRPFDNSSHSLRVAVVAAGGLRSFIFVAKSWQRYLLSPKVGKVYLFVHVASSSKKCIMISGGMDVLSKIGLSS